LTIPLFFITKQVHSFSLLRSGVMCVCTVNPQHCRHPFLLPLTSRAARDFFFPCRPRHKALLFLSFLPCPFLISRGSRAFHRVRRALLFCSLLSLFPCAKIGGRSSFPFSAASIQEDEFYFLLFLFFFSPCPFLRVRYDDGLYV